MINCRNFCCDPLALTQFKKFPFGFLAIGVIDLVGINAKQSDFCFLNAQAVSVDNVGGTFQLFADLRS
jgi:hypothetical protein